MRSILWQCVMTCLILTGLQSTQAFEWVPKAIESGGVTRNYTVYLPDGFTTATASPMVLGLHGGGGSGLGFVSAVTDNTLQAAANARGMVLVLPDAIDGVWKDGRSEDAGVDTDVVFISDVIEAMISEYNIDRRRVYATGLSNGAFLTIRLALELSDKIAAAAPATAQLPVRLQSTYPELPISLMILNGTADPLVDYNGGEVRPGTGEFVSTDDTAEHFRSHNNCSPDSTVTSLPDTDPTDGCRIETETFSGGDAGTEVIIVKVIGGGHTWPGGRLYMDESVIGKLCNDANASDMVLDFFLTHELVNRHPVIDSPPIADPSDVELPATTTLSVLASDPDVADPVTYTWEAASPFPSPVSFSTNGTTTSDTVVATFTDPGSYGFQVRVEDSNGGVVVSGAVIVDVTESLPAIEILGNGIAINNGDTTPSATDHTDFGAASSGNTLSRTFTVKNTGTATLNLGSDLVQISGVDATAFTVTTQPSATIDVGNSSSFSIEFAADASIGIDTADVTIKSDDPVAPRHTFKISATVTEDSGDPPAAPDSGSDSGCSATGSGSAGLFVIVLALCAIVAMGFRNRCHSDL